MVSITRVSLGISGANHLLPIVSLPRLSCKGYSLLSVLPSPSFSSHFLQYLTSIPSLILPCTPGSDSLHRCNSPMAYATVSWPERNLSSARFAKALCLRFWYAGVLLSHSSAQAILAGPLITCHSKAGVSNALHRVCYMAFMAAAEA